MSASKILALIVVFVLIFFSVLFVLCRIAVCTSVFTEDSIQNTIKVISQLYDILTAKEANPSLKKSQVRELRCPGANRPMSSSRIQDCRCSWCIFHSRRSSNHQSRVLADFLSVSSFCPQPVFPSTPLRASLHPQADPDSETQPISCTSRSLTLEQILANPEIAIRRINRLSSSGRLNRRFGRKRVSNKASTRSIHISNSRSSNLDGGFLSECMLISPLTFSEEPNFDHADSVSQQEERIKQEWILDSMEPVSVPYDGGYKMGVQRSAFLRVSTCSGKSSGTTISLVDPTAEQAGDSLTERQQKEQDDADRKVLKKLENERVRKTRKKLFAKNLGVGKENAAPIVVPVPIPGPFLSSAAFWTNSMA